MRVVLREDGGGGWSSSDVDMCFLLCLLGESNGKCLSAPLSRGHQVSAL